VKKGEQRKKRKKDKLRLRGEEGVRKVGGGIRNGEMVKEKWRKEPVKDKRLMR